MTVTIVAETAVLQFVVPRFAEMESVMSESSVMMEMWMIQMNVTTNVSPTSVLQMEYVMSCVS